MIYIFVNNSLFLPQTFILKLYIKIHYDIDVKIINNIDLDYIDINDDIIIPFGIDESKECYNLNVKKTFVVSPKIYETLDNKSLSYQFALDNEISSVNTLSIEDSNNQMEEIINFVNNQNYNIFIIKQNHSLNSSDIEIVDSNELISNTNLKDCVIQPYLGNHELFNCNALCVNGKIIDLFILTQDHHFKKDSILGKNFLSIDRLIVSGKHKFYNGILNSCKKIISNSNYSGLIDIEFLCKNKDILLLEINPRVSGQALTLLNHELIYIERILIKYIFLLETKENKIKLFEKIQKQNKHRVLFGSGANMKYPLIYLLIILLLIILCIIVVIFKK
jgi:hypothetical protein